MATMTALGLLLVLLLGMTTANNQGEQVCVTGRNVTLILDYFTNATGHPTVNAHLEQPMKGPGWRLDFQLGTSACSHNGEQRKTLTLTLSGAPEEKPTPKPAPPGYVMLPGLGHYRAPPVAADWQTARDLCRKENAALAVPASEREAQALLAHFPFNATGSSNTYDVWIGVNDIAQEGKFVTADGVPLEQTGFAKFLSGQPSGGKKENCLVLLKNTKLLADGDCVWKLPYLCKVPL